MYLKETGRSRIGWTRGAQYRGRIPSLYKGIGPSGINSSSEISWPAEKSLLTTKDCAALSVLYIYTRQSQNMKETCAKIRDKCKECNFST